MTNEFFVDDLIKLLIRKCGPWDIPGIIVKAGVFDRASVHPTDDGHVVVLSFDEKDELIMIEVI